MKPRFSWASSTATKKKARSVPLSFYMIHEIPTETREPSRYVILLQGLIILDIRWMFTIGPFDQSWWSRWNQSNRSQKNQNRKKWFHNVT